MPYAETVAADEETRFAGYAAELVALQRAGHAKNGMGRALHRKQVAGLEGTLVVLDGPPELRVGPFAQPGTELPAYLRFSNGGADRSTDARPDIRGLAVKLVGVEGKKVLGEAKTQDLLMVSAPVQPFRDPDEFIRFVRAARSGRPQLMPVRVVRSFGVFRGVGVLRALARATKAPDSFATATWYSAAPVRWGDTAARYGLFPVDPPGPAVATGDDRDRYGDDLAARLRAGSLVFELRVQTWADEATTPIEDASADWPTPYRAIARLTVPSVDLSSERSRQVAAWVERLSFDPWHAVEELRPLGAMMRARKHAYFASLTERSAAPEPTGPFVPEVAKDP